MNEKDEVRLRHMLDAARIAVMLAEGRTREDLDSNIEFGLAAVQAIQIIGEAANQVSAETRELAPDLPWRGMIGMRHKLVHDYMDVDYDVVWLTITQRLPALVRLLETIIPPEDELDEQVNNT